MLRGTLKTHEQNMMVTAGSWSIRALRLENDCNPLVKTAIFTSRNVGVESVGKCSLYRAVGVPIVARALRLQPHLQPHG